MKNKFSEETLDSVNQIEDTKATDHEKVVGTMAVILTEMHSILYDIRELLTKSSK